MRSMNDFDYFEKVERDPANDKAIKELEKVKEKVNKVETMRCGDCGVSYKQPFEVKEEILEIISNEIYHLKKL